MMANQSLVHFYLLIRSATANCEGNIESRQRVLLQVLLRLEPALERFNETDIKTLLSICLSWIQTKDPDYVWLERYGYKLLAMVAKSHPSIIQTEFSSKLAQHILSDNNCTENNLNLKSALLSMEGADDERKLKETLSRHTCNILTTSEGIKKPIYQVFLKLEIFPEDQNGLIAKFVATRLADLNISKETQETKKIADEIIEIGKHWLNSEEKLKNKREYLLMSELYQILRQDATEPCATVSQLLTIIDQARVRDSLRLLPSPMLLQATQCLTKWLVDWPYTANVVAPHALDCLVRLTKFSAESKIDEVTTIASEIAPKLLATMVVPVLQCCSSVFFFLMVVSFTSEEPIKKLLPTLPVIVQHLKNSPRIASHEILTMLAGICLRIADMHPQHAETVTEIFKDVLLPTEEKLHAMLVKESWFSDTVENLAPANTSSNLQVLTSGPRGLNNLGNTCYMNSVLQCLFFTPRFRRPVLTSNPVLPKELVLWQLQYLFSLMSYSQRPAISPSTEFRHVIRPPGFTPGHQEDCSEFLVYLLNTLHEQEESLRAPAKLVATTTTLTTTAPTHVVKIEPKSPDDEPASSPGLGLKRWTTEEDLSDSDPATLLNCRRKARSLATFDETPTEDKANPPAPPAPPLTDAYSDSKDSGIHSVGSADIQEDEEEELQPETLVQKVFGGKQMTIYKCLDCDFEYRTTDQFLDLQLAIPLSEDNLDVKHLISYLLKPEKLTGDNQYHCRNCNKLQDANRTIVIEKPPEHLILTLKRFHYEQSTNQIAKLMIPIECPSNILLPTSKSDQDYELYGIVLHTGSSPHSGHYHTQAKCGDNWLWLNDETVTSVSDLDLGKADTPYVLFYRQKNIDDSSIQEPTTLDILPRLQLMIQQDNRTFQASRNQRPFVKFSNYNNSGDNSSPPPPPPSSGGCGDNLGQSTNRFVF